MMTQIEASEAAKVAAAVAATKNTATSTKEIPQNRPCIDSCLQLCEERGRGGRGEMVLSPLVVDDGQQTFLP